LITNFRASNYNFRLHYNYIWKCTNYSEYLPRS